MALAATEGNLPGNRPAPTKPVVTSRSNNLLVLLHLCDEHLGRDIHGKAVGRLALGTRVSANSLVSGREREDGFLPSMPRLQRQRT